MSILTSGQCPTVEGPTRHFAQILSAKLTRNKMDRLRFMNEDEAVAFLKSCEDRIAELEAEVALQHSRKKAIEERIIEIRSYRAPMGRLPRELLLQVFSRLALDDPLNLGTILLVCKYWKDIARNSPTLWARFRLDMKPDATAITRQTQHLNSALHYSLEIPLDINLHLPTTWDLWSDLAKKMLSTSRVHKQDEDEEDYCQNIEAWLYDAHINEEYTLVFYRDIDTALSNYLRVFSGQDSRNLGRLRSLTIKFHATQFLSWMHENFFHYEMPMLEQLVIRNYDGIGSLPGTFCFPIPRLTRLATNIVLPINEMVTTEGQLTHLVVALDESSHDPFPDFRFTRNLTHLYINYSWTSEWMFGQRSSDFQFPVLQDLGVSGNVPVEFINAPRLTSLRLCGAESYEELLRKPPIHPKLTRLHLRGNTAGVEKNVVPYAQGLLHLTELGFIYYPFEVISMEYLDRVKTCALLKDLVVKVFKYSGSDFFEGFDVYDSTPVFEIKL